ncbi:uncharacterized protein LOC143036854 [Oratosquilla oratoria]|uniref:uncharacterized protein LOC143036854 n=1 Tax=Oratosquilla oratoria TaxID=337810 RepID=UPI003F76F0F3
MVGAGGGSSSSAGPQSLHGLPFGGGIPHSCAMCSRERNLCRIISGIFTRPTLPYGYSLITPIPAGVCNITITEMKASKNFFALRRPDGTYLLNGNWDIEAAGDYPIGGTVFSYTPSQGEQGERLSAPGPLHKPIELVLIAQSPNPGIKYEFRVPLPELLGVQPGAAHSPNFALPGQGSSFRQPPPPSAPASGAAGVGLTGTGVGVHTPTSPLGTAGQSRSVGSAFSPQNPGVRPESTFSNTGFSFGSRNPSITGTVPVGGIPSGSIRPGSLNPRQGVLPLIPNTPSRGSLTPGRGTLNPSPGQTDPLLSWGSFRSPTSGRTTGGQQQQQTPSDTGRGVYSLYPIAPNVQSGLETPRQQPRLPNLPVSRQGIQGSIFVPPGSSGFGLSGRDRGGGGVLFPGTTSGGSTGLRDNSSASSSSSSSGSRPQVPPEFPANSVPLRPIPISGHREDKNILSISSRIPAVGGGAGVSDVDDQRPDRLRPAVTTASPVQESTRHRIRHGHHKQPIRPGRPFTTTKRPRTSQQQPKRHRSRNPSTSGSRRKTGGSLYGHEVQQTEPQRTRSPRRRGEGSKGSKRERKRHPGGRTPSSGRSRSGRRYEWVLKGYTECSRPCGGGNRTNVVSCQHRRKGRVVADRRCAKLPFPNTTVVSCNLKPCPAEWMPGEWGPCSVTCGMGVQTRPLLCKQVVSPKLTMTVPEGICLSPPAVSRSQVCKLRECASEHPTWEVGPWGNCTAPCGVGTRRRSITCVEKGLQVEEDKCSGEYLAEEEELCHMGSCAINTWFFSDWSDQCSETCGTGVQTRRLYCSGGPETDREGQCPAAHRPEASRPCRGERGCGGQWFAGPWGTCSARCSGGEETRSVLCVVWGRGQWRVTLETDCRPEEKPHGARPCNLEPCTPEWYSSEWSQCSVTCGAGVMRREIKCLDEHQRPSSDCGNGTQPANQQRCSLNPCPNVSAEEEEEEEEEDKEVEEAEDSGPETESPFEHTTTSVGEFLEEEEEEEEMEDVEEGEDGFLTGLTSPSSTTNVQSSFGTTSRTSEVITSEASTDFDDFKRKDFRKEFREEEEEEEELVAQSQGFPDVTSRGTVKEPKETLLYDDDDEDGAEEGADDNDDDDEVANELIVETPKGDDLNIIPDKDAQGDESVSVDEEEEEEDVEEEEEKKRRKKNKKRKKGHHSSESHERKSSHSRPSSCIDRIKNCHLVFRARLCRIKFYNKQCCRTCHAR